MVGNMKIEDTLIEWLKTHLNYNIYRDLEGILAISKNRFTRIQLGNPFHKEELNILIPYLIELVVINEKPSDFIMKFREKNIIYFNSVVNWDLMYNDVKNRGSAEEQP